MTEMQTREWHRWYQRMSNVQKASLTVPSRSKRKVGRLGTRAGAATRSHMTYMDFTRLALFYNIQVHQSRG